MISFTLLKLSAIVPPPPPLLAPRADPNPPLSLVVVAAGVTAATTGARSERSGVGGALERRWVSAQGGCGRRPVADGAAGLRVGRVIGRSQ